MSPGVELPAFSTPMLPGKVIVWLPGGNVFNNETVSFGAADIL
jgi:hypothetical protein